MAIPLLRYKIEFLRLEGVTAAIAGAVGPFAFGFVSVGSLVRTQSHRTGRSRPISSVVTNFDLTAEAQPWVFEVDIFAGDVATVRAEIRDDKGDSSTATLATVIGLLPPAGGEFRFNGGPTLVVRVTATLLSRVLPAAVARATGPVGTSATLVVPQGLVVEITDIRGVFKPDPTATPPRKGSTRVAGYTSQDDLGRIFTNRLPDDTWRSGTQFIEVDAKVTGVGGVPIPGASEIKWTVVDVDDSTNDDPEFHSAWGAYVDANDYDLAKKPIGAHPGDNPAAHSAGNSDSDKLFGGAIAATPTARWERAPGGPAVTPTSREEARSALVAGATASEKKTAIKIHCPRVLGTNIVLKAELTTPPVGIPLLNAATGVMTMWCRLDVEVARMAGAHSVNGALNRVAAFFHPACVQLDFQPEHVVTGAALDKANMAPTDDLETTSCTAWINDPAVFLHRGQAGWFFLGAARFPSRMPAVAPPPLFSGVRQYTFTRNAANREVVGITTTFANVEFVRFKWTVGADDLTATSRVRSVPGGPGAKKFELWGEDVTFGFTGHDSDGSTSHAMATQNRYFPRSQLLSGSAALTSAGYNVPLTGATLELVQFGAVKTAGISPPLPHSVTGEDVFAGRTVLFTHHRKFSDLDPAGVTPPTPRSDFDDLVLQTVVHEFLHAFGMPHKCGHWNWRTPRNTGAGSTASCCMNYFNTWLVDPSTGNVMPGTAGKQGPDMCGRHLMEVRRVHLDENKGLNW